MIELENAQNPNYKQTNSKTDKIKQKKETKNKKRCNYFTILRRTTTMLIKP